MAEEEAWSELFGIGTRSIVENAKRLGLTWNLRMGTVTEATTSSRVQVRMDGDDLSITVTSMVAGTLFIGDRVYVISVPPGGNFIVGIVTRFFPGQRIATSKITTNSGTFTGVPVQVASVTADLIEGITYKVVFNGGFATTIDGTLRVYIKENSVGGTDVQIRDIVFDNSGTVALMYVEAFFLAVATGSKTFVAAGDVLAGGGTANLTASATFPSYMYVDYVGAL
jgi:hypothetical protein